MPLLQGKVQYHMMKKELNIHAVMREMQAWSVSFNPSINCRNLIDMLKEDMQTRNYADKSASKFSKSITVYNNFKWNSYHFDD
eukprot:7482153-Ditylum_brightwellii.AAC.1